MKRLDRRWWLGTYRIFTMLMPAALQAGRAVKAQRLELTAEGWPPSARGIFWLNVESTLVTGWIIVSVILLVVGAVVVASGKLAAPDLFLYYVIVLPMPLSMTMMSGIRHGEIRRLLGVSPVSPVFRSFRSRPGSLTMLNQDTVIPEHLASGSYDVWAALAIVALLLAFLIPTVVTLMR
jgi:hypothetical protein